MWGRFIVLLVLSLACMFIDHHYSYLAQPRSWLSAVTTPVQWLADAPDQIKSFVSKNLTSRTALVEENERLKATNLLLEQRLQKFSSLSTQNKRLRELLNSSQHMKGKVKIAEVVGVDPDPQIKQIIINKGSGDDAVVGQPILDASGIMGQIISTNYFASRVLLITDSSSRIPVEVNRTGYRAIAAGNYADDTLSLLNIPETADIKIGDLLVSSGLADRFPSGYPVAKITSVIKEPGQGFIKIQATPMAKINRSRLVLMLFPSSTTAKNSQDEKHDNSEISVKLSKEQP